MTAKDAAQLLGRRGLYGVKGMTVRVIVNDVREVFGRLDLNIAPEAGDGTAWVAADQVNLEPRGAA